MKTRLWNVIAVEKDHRPIHTVNAGPIPRRTADMMVARLYREGAVRAYAVRHTGQLHRKRAASVPSSLGVS